MKRADFIPMSWVKSGSWTRGGNLSRSWTRSGRRSGSRGGIWSGSLSWTSGSGSWSESSWSESGGSRILENQHAIH